MSWNFTIIRERNLEKFIPDHHKRMELRERLCVALGYTSKHHIAVLRERSQANIQPKAAQLRAMYKIFNSYGIPKDQIFDRDDPTADDHGSQETHPQAR